MTEKLKQLRELPADGKIMHRQNLGQLSKVMQEVTRENITPKPTEETFNSITDEYVIALLPVTRADGRNGLWILEAEGKVTDRRKKLIKSRALFPDDEEQARIDTGATYKDIVLEFYRQNSLKKSED